MGRAGRAHQRHGIQSGYPPRNSSRVGAARRLYRGGFHRAGPLDCIAVDSIEQARMESGDLLMALDDAERDWNSPRIVELKDVVAGRVQARTAPKQITLFKSNGLAVEDVIAAAFVYERARAAGIGAPVPHS